MVRNPSSLEIRLHLINGKTEAFEQNDPKAIAHIFNTLQPAKIFGQPNLLIAGKYSMTAYSSASICMIEFVMDVDLDWPFPHGIDDIAEITQEEFWERYRPGEDDLFVREQPREPGEELTAYCEIQLASGESVYSEVHTKVAAHLDRLQNLRQLLSGNTLFARRREGGVTFVNVANIARFGIHPGPPETPRTAWPAHHKTR